MEERIDKIKKKLIDKNIKVSDTADISAIRAFEQKCGIILPKELVDIKVIEENKKSFFDILAPKVVKVELKEKEAKMPEEYEIETTEEELENSKKDIEKFLKELTEKFPNIINLLSNII